MSESLGRAVLDLAVDPSRLTAGLASAQAQSQSFISRTGATFSSLGTKATALGRTMTRSVTLPILGIGIAAVKIGKDFDAELTNISALVGVSEKQLGKWRDEILEMGPELGKAPKELAEALYFVTSSGFEGAAAMRVLRASAKASSAGLGDLATVADAVTSAVNAYGEKNLKASKATDVLLAAVREGKVEGDAFAGSIGRVIPIASEMGISFDQVAAAMAGMSLSGLDAAEGATALRGIMASLLKPSVGATATFKELGFSMDEVRASVQDRGLMPTLMELKDRIGENEDAWAKLFPNVRALTGVLNLTGKNAEKNIGIFRELASATGDTDAAFAKASESADFKFKQALSALQVALISVWDVIKPIFTSLMETITNLAIKFTELSPSAQKVIVIIGLIAAAIGPLLVIFGVMASAIGAIVTAIGAISLPVVAAVAAIGALVAALIYAWNNSEAFRNAVITAWENVRAFAAEMWPHVQQIIQTAWEHISAFAKEIWPDVRAIIVDAMTLIGAVIEGVTSAIKTIWDRWGDEIIAVAETTWNFVKNFIKAALDIIHGVIKVVTGLIKGDWGLVWDGIKKIFGGVWDGMVALVKLALGLMKETLLATWEAMLDLTRGIWEKFKQTLSNAWNALKQLASDVWNGIKNTISNVWNGIKDLVSSAVSGLTNSISNAWENIRSSTSNAWNSIRNALSNAWDRIRDAVRNGISSLIGFVKALPGRIINALGDLGGLLVGAGKALIQGLINGIRSMIPSLLGLAASLASDVANTVKGALRIGSPSRVFEAIGKDIVRGLELGLRTMSRLGGRLEKSMDILSNAVEKRVDKISNDVEKQIDKLRDKLDSDKLTDAARASIERQIDHLKSVARHQIDVLKDWHREQVRIARSLERDLDSAMARLERIHERAAAFKDALTGGLAQFGDIVGHFGSAEQVAAEEIATFLQGQTALAEQFASTLQQLAARGLNVDTLAQIAAGGPRSMALATGLLQGGESLIALVNKSSNQISRLGENLSEILTNWFFGDQMRDAQAAVIAVTDQLEAFNRSLAGGANRFDFDIGRTLGALSDLTGAVQDIAREISRTIGVPGSGFAHLFSAVTTGMATPSAPSRDLHLSVTGVPITGPLDEDVIMTLFRRMEFLSGAVSG